MGRPKRQCAGGIAYHVLNRANGKLRIFRKHADFEAFEHILVQALARFPMRLCGYCIMGNHWHMLLWPHSDGDISEFVRWVTLTHTQRWHASHGTAKDAPIIDSGPMKLPTNWNRYVNIVPNKKNSLTLENCIKRGTPYGGDRWIAAISNKLGLQMTLRPRGRPKKGSPTWGAS